MTRPEFEAFMMREGWSVEQRDRWSECTPICNAEQLKTEMSRLDGYIGVTYESDDWTSYRRFFKKWFA